MPISCRIKGADSDGQFAGRRCQRLGKRAAVASGLGLWQDRGATAAPPRERMSQPPPTAAAYRDPLLGAVLAERYRVESLLARGGTGAVYRATQLLLQRPVAVKIMRPDLEGDERETFEERFLREASLMGALQHPNIVTVHDFGRLDD